MLSLDTITDALPSSPSNLLTLLLPAVIISFAVYRAFLEPLRKLPGPLLCRITPLWLWYHAYIGDESTQIDLLHRHYGPVVRIAPNEVSISDGAALAPIYTEKGAFLKSNYYANFDIEGHSTIFSALDPGHRAVRSKAVLPLFSLGSIRSGSDAIEGCVDRFVSRLKDEADESRRATKETGQPKPVNVLNLSRSLALDAVSSYLFGSAFGGIGEKSTTMSASPFVDFFVAFGRFWLLPPWLFQKLEWTISTFWSSPESDESSQKVGSFAERLVQTSEKTDGTYQGRLLKAGLTNHEVKIQMEDLAFAGTDSTGMNLSTICWYLAKQPDVYSALRAEIAQADAQTADYNPQTLPYLDAVIREGLRISMANPTRFPRVTPPQGFNFLSTDKKQQYFIPPGVNVGLQPFTLHFNPDIYPDPHAFNPDRWLDGKATPEMQRDFIPFGLGTRQCIARNLATMELFLAIRGIARAGVLEDAQAVGERVEILEWFNSKVKSEKMELIWR